MEIRAGQGSGGAAPRNFLTTSIALRLNLVDHGLQKISISIKKNLAWQHLQPTNTKPYKTSLYDQWLSADWPWFTRFPSERGYCKVNTLLYIFVTILLRAQEIIFHSKLFLDMLCPVNKGAWLGPTLREKACRSMWAGVWGRSLPEILTIQIALRVILHC